MAPPFGNAGESKYANGSTNIDCNYIGIPWHEAKRPVGELKNVKKATTARGDAGTTEGP